MMASLGGWRGRLGVGAGGPAGQAASRGNRRPSVQQLPAGRLVPRHRCPARRPALAAGREAEAVGDAVEAALAGPAGAGAVAVGAAFEALPADPSARGAVAVGVGVEAL